MKILLLGSTGSIGRNTCNCIRRHPELFSLTGLAAYRNIELLRKQFDEFKPSRVCIGDAQAAGRARNLLPSAAKIYEGESGLEALVNEADYDVLLNALVGAVGFRPTVAALMRGKRVALANKESLVIGGEVIARLIAQFQGSLVPVDSEHSAIMQCLSGEERSSIESLILTASGGPFRDYTPQMLSSITPEQALNHPTWQMGKKITIDAATLMNKGFEVIEAHHLFQVPYNRLQVLIHPQSIVHSMVVFHDGAVMAQCGVPDMELPIQYALSCPQRLPLGNKRLDLARIGSLQFFAPDMHKFPCLKLSIEAGERGQTYPAVLNAANEIAVEAFLDKKISFDSIPRIVEQALAAHTQQNADSVEIIEEIDKETRKRVLSTIGKTKI